MDRLSARFFVFSMVAAVCLVATGCSDQKIGEPLPSRLRIGVLPYESSPKVGERYEPLRRHLAEYLGMPCELVVYETYDSLVESFGAGNVDLAHFGGLTFLQAKLAYDAVPLVTRDIATRNTSYLLARADSTGNDIVDYEDSVFSFGSRLSTAGHLMPRLSLADQGITPETFFRETRYSGGNDRTVEWVRGGTVALGAVHALTFKTMVADGQIDAADFRVVWETPPYANTVWCVQAKLGKTARKKLREAFLVLSPENAQHDEILRSFNSGGFYPADDDAYSDLEEIASTMGLLR